MAERGLRRFILLGAENIGHLLAGGGDLDQVGMPFHISSHRARVLSARHLLGEVQQAVNRRREAFTHARRFSDQVTRVGA